MTIYYKRKFIILKDKYSNIKGYKLKGHLKLEIKDLHANINLSIENAEVDSLYTLTLISDEIIQLGKIYTDSYGRAKIDLGLKSEDFLQGELEQGAIIIHRGQELLLGGYMDKDDSRIEEYIQGQNRLKIEPEPEYEPQPQIEEESKEDEEIIEPEAFEQEEEAWDLEYEYNLKKRDQTTDYVLSILRYFPYIEPFKEDLEGHNWWLIDYSEEAEEGFLPYFDYLNQTNSIELMEKYKHYLFGLFNQEEKVRYYVYALPGDYSLEEHPNEGLFGFNTWYEGVDQVGYWLLYIDPMTGRIVDPMDPIDPS